MSRDLSTVTIENIEDDVVYPFFAVELLFDGANTIRMWTGFGTLVLEDATEWVGLGTMLDISSIEETAEMAVKGATITLSGVSSEALSLALSEPYQGRVCNIYFGTFSDPGSILQQSGSYILTQDGSRIDVQTGEKGFNQLFSGYMLWYDTATDLLKMRSEANDAWINIVRLDQSGDVVQLILGSKVVQPDGTSGSSGDTFLSTLPTSFWEAGTNTANYLVSPAKIKAAILALSPDPLLPIGDSQAWAVVSRASGTSYQNTTGRSIEVCATLSGYETGGPDSSNETTSLQVSSNGSTWVTLGTSKAGVSFKMSVSAIVPKNHYYRYIGSSGSAAGVATFTALS